MLSLTIDAGNTHLKAVLFEADRIVREWRLERDQRWNVRLLDALDGHGVDAVGAACVVPVEDDVRSLAVRIALSSAFFVSAEATLPFAMSYRTPGTLGADRLAAAAAAWHRFGGTGVPVVSIDLGTAVTTEVVSGDGRFLGGTIAPGPTLQARSLATETARLPHETIGEPPPLIGDSTATAIQAGILYGVTDSVKGFIGRVERSLGTMPHVVLTGGWADVVSPLLDAPHLVDPHLVPRGIRYLMELNAPQS